MTQKIVNITNNQSHGLKQMRPGRYTNEKYFKTQNKDVAKSLTRLLIGLHSRSGDKILVVSVRIKHLELVWEGNTCN